MVGSGFEKQTCKSRGASSLQWAANCTPGTRGDGRGTLSAFFAEGNKSIGARFDCDVLSQITMDVQGMMQGYFAKL